MIQERRSRRRLCGLAIVMLVSIALAACTRPEGEGGTPIPGLQTGAPLYDEAIGPSDQETEIDE
jgi:hypothetical protein